MGLPRTEGAIPPSYNALQGIEHLEKAFVKRLEHHDADAVSVRTMLQCLELVFMACRDLCVRQSKIRDLRDPRFHQHATWHIWMLRYSLSVASHAISFTPSQACYQRHPTQSQCDYLESHSRVCHTYLQHLQALPDPKQKIIAGCVGSDDAAIIQHYKNIYLFLQLLLSRLNVLRVSSVANQDMVTFLSSSDLEAAFNAFSMRNDTYYCQFRVLHQIPELIARCIRERIETVKDAAPSASLLGYHLLRIRDEYRLITEAVQPMVRLMIPSEYRQIRRNLGVTSGSHSIELRTHLLGTNIKTLSALADSVGKGVRRTKHDRALIDLLIDQIASEALAWRDFHLALPRNTLGAGTVSLIGSEDAVAKPLHWRNTAAVETTGQGQSKLWYSLAEFKAVEELEQKLMQITANAAKDDFPEVEKRTGIYATKGAPKGATETH